MDATGAGTFMAAGQAGMNLWTAGGQRKKQRAIVRLEDKNRGLEHGLQDRQAAQQEADVNRGAALQSANQQSADLVGRGLSSTSSVVNQDQKMIEDERSRRYNAIQDTRSTGNQVFNNQSQILYHQRAMAKMQRNLDMVNSMIDGGAAGGLEKYGSY